MMWKTACGATALSLVLAAAPLESQPATGNTRLDLSAGVFYGGGGVNVRDQRFGTAASSVARDRRDG